MARPLVPHGEHLPGSPVSDDTFTRWGCRCTGCCEAHTIERDALRRGVDSTYLPPAPSPVNIGPARDEPTWRDDAACQSQPPETFYPEPGGDGKLAVDDARVVCARCPVVHECLSEALTLPYENDWGVWGGTTRDERRRMRPSA